MKDDQTTLFRSKPFFEIGSADIEDLKSRALNSELGRARICLHNSHDDPVQEMIIALVRGKPVSALCQPDVGRKSYCLLDGDMRVVVFDDTGARTREISLSSDRKRAPFMLTFPAAEWHACDAVTPVVVYLESIPGPFTPEVSKRQPWLP